MSVVFSINSFQSCWVDVEKSGIDTWRAWKTVSTYPHSSILSKSLAGRCFVIFEGHQPHWGSSTALAHLSSSPSLMRSFTRAWTFGSHMTRQPASSIPFGTPTQALHGAEWHFRRHVREYSLGPYFHHGSGSHQPAIRPFLPFARWNPAGQLCQIDLLSKSWTSMITLARWDQCRSQLPEPSVRFAPSHVFT